jgi:carboxypeptidase family protein
MKYGWKSVIRNLSKVAWVALLLSIGGVLNAQVETGRVVGNVRDVSGALITGADVHLVETSTSVARTAKTGSDGEFVFTQLQPGTYSVSVQAVGFKKAVQSPFRLDVNQVVRADITLVVGSIHEEVSVTAAEPLIESQTSSIGQVIETSRVNDLPLNGRNFIQLAYLSPGVNAGPQSAASTVPQQGGIPENERANGAIQVNGLTATNNNFLLNGFDNNEQQIGFETIMPAVDAIDEFKVQTNNFGADIGKGGAVVNIVLKSGSNQFHGGVYEFVRNAVFDAKNYFDSPTLPIAPFKQNQFGGTFGGPILRNKTFFFGDYQGTRIRQAQTNISIVPDPALRGGDFSGFGAPIFDPLTTDPVTGARQAFPGNVIPPCVGTTGRSVTGGGCLDPAALNLIALYPQPNYPAIQNAFLFNPVASNNQDSFDIRIDHQLTGKDSLFGTFSYNRVDALHPDPLPGLAGGGGFSGHIKNNARAVGISDVHTFAPDRINEFKIGYTRYVVNALQNFAGQDISTQMGIPGINDPNNLIATGGLTNINIFDGTASLGNICCFPEFLTENNYQLLDSFTYVHGRHTLKFGGDLRLRKHSFFQALNPQGVMSFDQQFTEDLTTGTGGSALASFLLGYPISASRDGQKEHFGMSWWEVSGYAMDDFRVSPKLTLNLGLRYDVFTPMAEDHNRLANFDFTKGVFVAPGMPGVSRSGNVVTDLNNFAPRFGFAYSPWDDNKTVLRGGFGIFYDLQANQNDAELAFNPTGLFFSQSINNPATSPSIRLSTGFPIPTYPTVQNPSGRTSAAVFNNRTTYIEEWNLNVERSLLKNLALQVAYVGTHGVKLGYLSNLNQPPLPLDSNFCGPDPTNCIGPNFGRPYFGTVPDVSGIRTESHSYMSISHALQVKVEKRFSKDWSLLSAYTWQHTIGQTEENEYLEPQNTHNPAGERGDNGPDYRHQFTSAISYELPFGPKKQFLASEGPMRWLAGGWQMNAIVAMYSGQAFTPLLSFDPTNTGSSAPRPDRIGNPYSFSNATSAGCPSNEQSLSCWYNPAAFTIPALAPGQQFAHFFGNARRGGLRGPATYNVDFSIFKNFPISERLNLQFRAEAFNLFNTPQFGIPAVSVDVPGFSGMITNTVHDPRQLQFALKLNF